jgi:hypothetical protein
MILERWSSKLKLGETEKDPCQDADPVKDVMIMNTAWLPVAEILLH